MTTTWCTPWLRITRALNGAWEYTGVLPDNTAWEQVAAALESVQPADHTGQPGTDPEVADADWIGEVGSLFEWIRGLERGRLEIGAGVVAVDGVLNNVARYAVIEKALDQYVQDAGMRLINRLALLPPEPGQIPEKSAD